MIINLLFYFLIIFAYSICDKLLSQQLNALRKVSASYGTQHQNLCKYALFINSFESYYFTIICINFFVLCLVFSSIFV